MVEENRKRKDRTTKREQDEVIRRDFMFVGLRPNIS